MRKERQPQNEIVKGTLDMMILRTLVGGDAHGHTVAKVIEHTSEDLLEVEQGSLYAARHRRGDGRTGRSMSWLRLLRRKRSDAELQEEIEVFLTEETADNVARGMSPEEARRQANVKLGNPQKVRESLWAQNSPLPLTNIGHDLKYALRTLSRTPGFSIITFAVMALCIGAATSLFTIERSVLLRPLPFQDPGRLVMVYEHHRGAGANTPDFTYNPVAPADFYDWRSKTRGFEDMAIMRD